MTRRDFCLALGAGVANAAMSGCRLPKGGTPVPRIGLQLFSAGNYIAKMGMERTLSEVAASGFAGVEFAGYGGCDAAKLRTMLNDSGLVACGTHVSRDRFGPDCIAETCEFNLAYGNNLIVCSGKGNRPEGIPWRKLIEMSPTPEIDDFAKCLCDFYNDAAERAAKFDCRIGLHNHLWEFKVRMMDGTSFWDYFFSHTADEVCMEQDVGWTTGAGCDPCVQYEKYPRRSPTLHAKENGEGDGVKTFDGVLGKPGEPGAVGVDWDRLIRTARRDGVEWYVVECERHRDGFSSVRSSYAFLRERIEACL